ncbi:MAG TPA: hypothetical protein VM934_05580 [Pyrinomonadaceae bacterium]|nr:hypothetical protein [Pyrinomonadaceae bacterium]
MAQTVESTQDELTRRHRATTSVVIAMFVLTLLLMLVAVAGLFSTAPDPGSPVVGVLRLTILLFALGAIALRRTKFSAMRLRDIAALRGVSGLLETLQKTTVYVALIGGAIAVMSFVISLLTGVGADMVWHGVIAVVVLLYAYPRRAAWRRVVEATRQPGE